MTDTSISLGPCDSFTTWQTELRAEAMSREQEGLAYCSVDAPPIRFDTAAEAIAASGFTPVG
jgi:hypothetical protein